MKNHQEVSTVERRRIILEKLQQEKQVFITQLSGQFKTSEVTIRKDLRYLENKNLLVRSRGGAMTAAKMSDDLSVEERKVLYLDQKKSIAETAFLLIKPGDTIIIDSGTTLMQLAKLLNRVKELTVITNALDIAVSLSEFPNLKIIVPGGIFRRKSFSLVGVNAAENMQMYRADKYFVSADGISGQGLFTSNLEEGQIAKLIMSNAKENIVLVDSSKFSREGLINFAGLSKIHTLITDKKPPENYPGLLSESGVKVIISNNQAENKNRR